MLTKSTGNGVNSAVPRRGVYSSANVPIGGPHGTPMLIPGRAVEFQASAATARHNHADVSAGGFRD